MSVSARARLLSGASTKAVALCAVAGWVAALGYAGPARAADATAAQAATMEAQLRDGLAGLLGPAALLPQRPVVLTPEGDHYKMTVQLPSTARRPAGTPQSIETTGTVRPGDHGTWIVDDVKTTVPIVSIIDVPVPSTDKTKPPATVPMTYTFNATGQTGQILWDPSLTTPSTWTSTVQSISIATSDTKAGAPAGALGPLMNTIGPVNAVSTLRPAGDGRLDLAVDGTLQDYRMQTRSAGQPGAQPAGAGGAIDLAIKTARVTTALNGVNRTNGQTVLQTLVTLIVQMNARAAAGQPAAAPKLSPEQTKALLAAMQDFASSFALDETFDGFIVKTQGQDVALDHMQLGLDAHADAGLLKAGMHLGMSGLTLPALPLDGMEALIPTKIDLRPVVGGVATADVIRMATLASENKDPSTEEIMALFSHGGITGGIESMTIAVGGATFTGQGQVIATAPTPAAVTGSATITADNFDSLMQKVTSIPSLAQQAVPVMVFIKGVGRTVDNKLVWDIVYRDGKVLINNVDITAMAGGGAARAQPDAAPPAGSLPPAVGGPLKRPQGAPGSAPGSAPSAGRPLPSWAK